MNLVKAHIDWECRSTIDIKKSGSWRYVRSPRTEIMCLGAAIGDAPVEVFPVSAFRSVAFRNFIARILQDDVILAAHSAHMEYGVNLYVLFRLLEELGVGLSPEEQGIFSAPSKYTCTLARAAQCGLPLSLDKLGAALKLPIQKDNAGKLNMMRLCRPLGFDPLSYEPYYDEDPKRHERLLSYCGTDVDTERGADRVLPDLSAAEKRVWDLDLLINHRGIRVDRPLVVAAQEIRVGLIDDLNAQLPALTGGAVGSASEVARLKAFFAANGVETDTVNADAIGLILANPETPKAVRDVALIRQQVSKSSTAKFAAALNVMDDADNRFRGAQQYFGSHTGRWAGRLVQIQNLPKFSFGKTPEEADRRQAERVTEILRRDAAEFIFFHGNSAMEALSFVLRGIFLAADGKELFVADFASIEAKVVLWLAGDDAALGIIRSGKNLYIEMAKRIYNREDITKSGTPKEYAVGKETILGCFTPDTIVLTSHGPKPILNVTVEDLLWDGIEWVAHDGVAYQGEKQVIRFAGIGCTPDHRFLSSDGKWVCAEAVAAERIPSLLSESDSVLTSLRGSAWVCVGEWTLSKSDAIVGESRLSTATTSSKVNLLGAISVLERKPSGRTRRDGDTRRSLRIGSLVPVCSTASPQQFNGAIIQSPPPTFTTGLVESQFGGPGAKTGPRFFAISLVCQDGQIRASRWTGLTSTKGMPLVTYDSQPGLNRWRTVVAAEACGEKFSCSAGKSHVYDILNAGPRNRFTILTAAGPRIVHNCGFGMGKDRFFGNCQQKGISITPEQAELAVKSYREQHRPVVNMWYAIERAAANAIRTPGTVQNCCAGRVAFSYYKDIDFLVCRLPSGRPLYYYRPSLRPGVTPWGAEVEKIIYAGAGQGGKLEFFDTYGGALTENLVQAIARDLMVSGMLNVEAAGYPIVATIHDEIVAERVIGEGNLEEYMKLMCAIPGWAAGCPVTAEGFQARRYRK